MDSAIKQFGSIRDYPFPEIDPFANTDDIQFLAKKILDDISSISEPGFTVHIMGEFTFCYLFISMCKQSKISCYVSTTKREVEIIENGDKLSKFKFIQFRRIS
jgi:hypothetical protein